MRLADKVAVPLQPSIFDIHATHDFLREIHARKRHAKVQIGIIGMRAREGTISADQLKNFLGTVDVPVIGTLRDTQNYVQLAARGLTLWDVAPSRVLRDLEQWQAITKWIDA
jgi:chromosome partitioning protein